MGFFRVAEMKLNVFSNISALKLQRKFSMPKGCDFYVTKSNVQKSDSHEFQTHGVLKHDEGYNHPATGRVELGCLQCYS